MQVRKTSVPGDGIRKYENLSTIGKGGKCKYGKRKYKSAGVENISTETGRAILTQKWQKNITAYLRNRYCTVLFLFVIPIPMHKSLDYVSDYELESACKDAPCVVPSRVN